jgi:hypothetical protein
VAELRVPHRSRGQSLIDAMSDARVIEDSDERRVVRGLLMSAKLEGSETVGQVLDDLERMTPAERRRVVDVTHQRVGLPTLVSFRPGPNSTSASDCLRCGPSATPKA